MPIAVVELLISMAVNGSRVAGLVMGAYSAVRAIRFIREAIKGKRDSG